MKKIIKPFIMLAIGCIGYLTPGYSQDADAGRTNSSSQYADTHDDDDGFDLGWLGLLGLIGLIGLRRRDRDKVDTRYSTSTNPR